MSNVKKGFTLVELLEVDAILGVLAEVGIVSFGIFFLIKIFYRYLVILIATTLNFLIYQGYLYVSYYVQKRNLFQ